MSTYIISILYRVLWWQYMVVFKIDFFVKCSFVIKSYLCFCKMTIMKTNKCIGCGVKYSGHALSRSNERSIKLDKALTYDDIKELPIYTTDNGCTKYLDIKGNIVYYVRNKKVVTMIKTNPIQMLRYYAFGKNLEFNRLCRDHVFNNCNRENCKFIHINI